jgi:DNA-binding NarL/FixJ family response regulator
MAQSLARVGSSIGQPSRFQRGTPPCTTWIALVGEGMANRHIGSVLFMAEKTASVHVSRILGKLSDPNRAAAAAAAQRLGVQRLAVAGS